MNPIFTGPVEYMLIAFPGNRFSGEIAPALHELVDSNTVHIIDLLFIKKDAEGNVLVVELDTLDDEEGAMFDEFDGDLEDLLSMDDIELMAAELPNNSAAGLLVWENLWAARFAQAIRNAHGEVIANERIPHELIQAAHAAIMAE